MKNTITTTIVAEKETDCKQEIASPSFQEILRQFEIACITGSSDEVASKGYILAKIIALSAVRKCADPQRKTAVTANKVSNSAQNPVMLQLKREIMSDVALLDNLPTVIDKEKASVTYAKDVVKQAQSKRRKITAKSKKAIEIAKKQLQDNIITQFDYDNIEREWKKAENYASMQYEKEVAPALNISKVDRENATKIQGETLGYGIDLVNEVFTELLECSKKATLEMGWIEKEVTEIALKKRIYYNRNEEREYKEIQIAPITKAYRKVKSYIEIERQSNNDKKYVYSDMEKDENVSDTLERCYYRNHIYSDIGGYATKVDGKTDYTGAYTSCDSIADDIDNIIKSLNLTDKQATALNYRLSGLTYESIANKMNISKKNAFKLVLKVQKRAFETGLKVPTGYVEKMNTLEKNVERLEKGEKVEKTALETRSTLRNELFSLNDKYFTLDNSSERTYNETRADIIAKLAKLDEEREVIKRKLLILDAKQACIKALQGIEQ